MSSMRTVDTAPNALPSRDKAAASRSDEEPICQWALEHSGKSFTQEMGEAHQLIWSALVAIAAAQREPTNEKAVHLVRALAAFEAGMYKLARQQATNARRASPQTGSPEGSDTSLHGFLRLFRAVSCLLRS